MKRLSAIFILLFCFFLYAGQTEANGGSQMIIINKKTNTLAFYEGGALVKTFRVATGKSRSLTPEGTFRIVTMIKNRPYYKHNIPGGNPRNPLGDRWMGLEVGGTYGTTYAIHGNSNESSIGKYVSAGCVRMHNAEVRWLFDQVQMNTPVVITYSASSFDEIAMASGYGVTVPSSVAGVSTPTDGWVQAGGKKSYYKNGAASTGWQTIDGKKYFFDKQGAMKTGWMTSDGKKYYLDSNGVMKTGWIDVNGKRFNLDQDGVMKTGWLEDGGQKYYLEDDGAMKIGWFEVNGQKYYFDGTGVMKTGWVEDNGMKYYLNANGIMRTGWLLDGGTKYYLDPSGVMKTGWLEENGQKYYFDSNGAVKTGWLEQGGQWHYFDETGMMKTGWINETGKWYYIHSNGALKTAFSPVDSGSSAQDVSNTGWVDLSGNSYFLGSTKVTVPGWVNYQNNWYYLYVNADMAASSMNDVQIAGF
ncbi:L,D-transpeptidase family protein [Neobacillus dielmonensis]|uniref:L,D-transpeptidase family protein n=1 Tax=Neobacillus dielmonensis TaxID=1347369 RepID=UPI000694E0C4|nr:L,D-transpeptidase family protein [Neobacillus dielmonensis]